MSAEIKLEIISNIRTLIGISYMKGMNTLNNKQIIFHEIGIGFLFFGIFITFYNKGES
jgi:hypothetical protein